MATSLALRFPPTLNPKSPNSRPKTFPSIPPNCLPFPPLVTSSLHPPILRSPLLSSVFTCRRTPVVFVARAVEDGGTGGSSSLEEEEARGQSTLPERFRYLTKEVPEKPVRWPWLIAAFFLVYAWRSVLWELSNWKKAVMAILQFVGYVGKLLLAFIFRLIGDPLTAMIQCVEFSLNFARSVYSSIVASAPVPELTMIILLTSAVLAIAEAAAPNSINEQQYLLSAAGLVGFSLLRGFIPDILFLLLLISFFCYSRFIRKRDAVSASLPSAAVLVAVSEPWVRTVIILGYLALAVIQRSRSSAIRTKDGTLTHSRRLPLPLLLAALSIGIHLAAKWVRYRHLTWMIV